MSESTEQRYSFRDLLFLAFLDFLAFSFASNSLFLDRFSGDSSLSLAGIGRFRQRENLLFSWLFSFLFVIERGKEDRGWAIWTSLGQISHLTLKWRFIAELDKPEPLIWKRNLNRTHCLLELGL